MTVPEDVAIEPRTSDIRESSSSEPDVAVDSRPIAVRRGSAFERVAQELIERRKAISGTLLAAAVTLLLMAGSVLGWRSYAEWRLGRVELTTEGAPVVAQVLAETSDDPIGDPFDLVTRAIVSLPAGEYRLRVNGMGRLGRTYRFTVNRGETQTHSISIDEGRLLAGEQTPRSGFDDKPNVVSRPLAPVTVALELTPGKADLCEWSRGSLIRLDCTTGKAIWDAFHPAKPVERSRDPAHWLRDLYPGHRQAAFVEPAPDLDGDGTGDLVCTLPSHSAFLALSGKDGSMLWNYVAELDKPSGPLPDGPVLNIRDKPTLRNTVLIGEPVLGDLDRDGTPDLIATMLFSESDNEKNRRLAQAKARNPSPYEPTLFRRVIVAVSGRSGRWLWSYPVDKSFSQFSQSGWDRSAALVPGRLPLVAFVDGSVWIGLDPETGRPRVGPIDLGFVPFREVQHVDLDGDAEPEILAVGQIANISTLVAIDIQTKRRLWSETGSRMYEMSQMIPQPDWPIVVDLQDDGRPEIVVPNFGMMPPLNGYRGVRLLDGRTGQTRWAHPMRPETAATDGMAQIIAAPDLDGDGARDLVTVSTYEGKNPPTTPQAQPEEPERAYVDAISGKDGHPLWWWHVDLPVQRFTRVWKPQWWGRGPDGWPLLAVPLGGRHKGGVESSLQSVHLAPPVVHLLEASTGAEVHTLPGLTNANLADLDGDGLADLWGEVRGELRAFRGEAPEAWRALGRFHPPEEYYGGVDAHGYPAIDFDGDRIGDALIGGVQAPGASASQTTGSHTAMTRSGRDGHVIWKTVLDPQEHWFEPSAGESYNLRAFPLPDGDFDGDGTPDVIVQKYGARVLAVPKPQAATLPLQVLSGPTGRLLWSAGPLPPGFEAQGYSQIHWFEAISVEPGGAPDLLVRHGNTSLKPGQVTTVRRSPARPSLARISGRDGRILWDVDLADQLEPEMSDYVPPARFGDLNGDGALDMVQAIAPPTRGGDPGYELLAVSLRDGKRMWSRALRFQPNFVGAIHLGDLDGDKRPDVVVMEEILKANTLDVEVRAFDGRDGAVRWTWSGGAQFQNNRPPPWIVLASLSGDGKQQACVNFQEVGGKRRIVLLDENGKESARRDLPGEYNSSLYAGDLDGDGRDEILVGYGGRNHVWRHDLKELWSWPNEFAKIERLIPASPGQAGEVIVHPALALDGITGQPRWTGQRPLVFWPRQFQPNLLDRGNSTRPPLLIGDGLGATVCRVAVPANAQGRIGPARGVTVHAGPVPDDPRWTRPLPWLAWLTGPFSPWGFLAATGLALVNVVLPLSILRLVAGRRRFSLRALMALPVVATIPLMVYLMLEPVLPVGSSALLASEKRLFITGTAAGIPIILAVVLTGWSLARRRLRPAAALAGLTILTSFVIAAAWIRFDMKSMPSIEHHGSAGWQLVVLPGVYVACLFVLIGWVVISLFGLLRRRAIAGNEFIRRAPGVAIAGGPGPQ